MNNFAYMTNELAKLEIGCHITTECISICKESSIFYVTEMYSGLLIVKKLPFVFH